MSTLSASPQPRRVAQSVQPVIHLVFSGRTDHPLLKLLRPGFRHCLALVDHGGDAWTLVDPMASTVTVVPIPNTTGDSPPDWYRAHGHVVLNAGHPIPASRIAPIGIFSCVEMCKRLLGIRARHILTPYQLYRHVVVRTMTGRGLGSAASELANRSTRGAGAWAV